MEARGGVKLSVLQDDLQRALSQVSRAVAAKTALPVLSNVLLATEDHRLRIAATNLEIGITTWIEGNVEEHGNLTVDARLLSEFVATLPAGQQVDLRAEPNRSALTVQAGRDKASINGIQADDFPVIPNVGKDSVPADIDPRLLREMISQVEFAAAADDSRPVLAGVLMRMEGRKLTVAAADGFRLAVREGELQGDVPNQLEVIIPARALREFARIIGETDQPVRLQITPNQSQLLARVGDTEFLSRLIEGNFPDFRQIIPRDFTTTVDIDRDLFLNAVRRSSYFARDNNDVIRINVHSSDDEVDPGSVEISGNAAERGNSQSFVDATVSGPPVQIAFNSRYLSDVLGVVKGGHAKLGLNGPNQAGVIQIAGDDGYTHVIMPMVIGAQ